MNHWIIAPIVLPAMSAVVMLLTASHNRRVQRTLGVVSTLSLLAIAIHLLLQTLDGTIQTYALGAWPAPFGIILVLDRLSALMVLLTAVTGSISLLYAIAGDDLRGSNYHPLFQFQLMGLCGAFLTGDVFNLFVFFEVLLIASYGLMLHGGGRDRVRAGLHYVVFNLVGSSLFLIGVGTIYAVTGTLNMADLAFKVGQTLPHDVSLLHTGAMILLVVFSVKAAILPLCFWLPLAYGSATAPVAALFAIMTKVGVYAILRVYALMFGPLTGGEPLGAKSLMMPLALATIVVATLGAIAARRLTRLVAYLVIASVGTLMTVLVLSTPASITAAVYYLVQSTLVIAALFLLADLIGEQRGDVGQWLERTFPVNQPALLGGLFVIAAVAASGLPPLSGFVGKALVLRSALGAPGQEWVFAVVLVTGLFTVIALARAGSMIFWNVDPPDASQPVEWTEPRARGPRLLAVILALALVIGLTVFAGPLIDYSGKVARQLLWPEDYLRAVLSSSERVPSGTVPGSGEVRHEAGRAP
jgi:multicomponent K+:H+ antiporter subunit D